MTKNNQKPNIIIILADDLGYSDLGCYGSEIKTPNIDNLGNKGIKISQFYNQIVDVFVYTKVENTSNKINKFAELKIGIPGDDVIVKKTAKSFEEAINNAAESAERVLKRRKEKQRL